MFFTKISLGYSTELIQWLLKCGTYLSKSMICHTELVSSLIKRNNTSAKACVFIVRSSVRIQSNQGENIETLLNLEEIKFTSVKRQ